MLQHVPTYQSRIMVLLYVVRIVFLTSLLILLVALDTSVYIIMSTSNSKFVNFQTFPSMCTFIFVVASVHSSDLFTLCSSSSSGLLQLVSLFTCIFWLTLKCLLNKCPQNIIYQLILEKQLQLQIMSDCIKLKKEMYLISQNVLTFDQ